MTPCALSSVTFAAEIQRKLIFELLGDTLFVDDKFVPSDVLAGRHLNDNCCMCDYTAMTMISYLRHLKTSF